MKTKISLKILNVCGLIFFFKPNAWILWKLEIILTERPMLMFFWIILGFLGLHFLTQGGTRDIPLWFYLLVLHIGLSVIWSLVRTTLLEKIESKKPESHP